MNYFYMINDTIEFIEEQLKRPILLDELAERAFISKYHFLRIFKALTNKTPKDYIDERKLTEAVKKLKNGRFSVTDVAFEYGFESHEVFTRRFKRVFGITPIEVKRGTKNIRGIEPMEVIERDFTNRNNNLFSSFLTKQQKEIELVGKKIYFDPYSTLQLEKTTQFVSRFVEEYEKILHFQRLYGVVQSQGNKIGMVDYFTGVESSARCKDFKLERIILPESEYGIFTYRGVMADISNVVYTDVCNTLLLTERELNRTTVDLFEVYEDDYFKTRKFSIYVPIK